MKVSVVIPVYNPGVFIEPLIASLAAQTMPPEDFEAVFVDDGSSDETPERLARLAAERPNVRVITQENSGWPGRPRNVGTDAAVGDYVFYGDHDDWFGVGALEALYATARRYDSDIVIGKMAGHRRGVPRELFRRSVGHAAEPDVPLAGALTPHKLFRRAFLNEHNLRFPEGRRRLEDHVFVVRAYLLANVVSVYADEVCYHHIRRADAGNAAFSYVAPATYFGYVRETLDVLDELGAGAAFRTALCTRTLRTEMLQRLEGRLVLDYDDDHRGRVFDEVRRLMLERFPEEADALLPARQHALAAAVRAGDRNAVREHAEWQARVRFEARLEDLAWRGDALAFGWSVRMWDPTGPLLAGSPDRPVLAVSPGVAADLTGVTVDVVARSRSRDREHLLPGSCELRVDPDGALRLRGRTELPLQTAVAGRPLPDDVWDLSVWVQAFGWGPEFRLGATRTDAASAGCRPALLGHPDRLVRPYWTRPYDNLSVDVGASAAAVGKALLGPGGRRPRNESAGRTITVMLPIHVPASHDVSVRLRPARAGGSAPELPARLAPHPDGGVLTVRAARRRQPVAVDLELLIPPDGTALPLGITLGPRVGALRPAAGKVRRRVLRVARALRRRARRG